MSETNEQTGRKPFIVAGADGTDASIHALKWAVGQARMTGAKLIVIAAWEVPWTIMVSPTRRDEDYAQHAKALLDRSVEEGLADSGDLEVEVRMVEWRPTLHSWKLPRAHRCSSSAATGTAPSKARTSGPWRATAHITLRAPS